jgi:hypothetical protein
MGEEMLELLCIPREAGADILGDGENFLIGYEGAFRVFLELLTLATTLHGLPPSHYPLPGHVYAK